MPCVLFFHQHCFQHGKTLHRMQKVRPQIRTCVAEQKIRMEYEWIIGQHFRQQKRVLPLLQIHDSDDTLWISDEIPYFWSKQTDSGWPRQRISNIWSVPCVLFTGTKHLTSLTVPHILGLIRHPRPIADILHDCRRKSIRRIPLASVQVTFKKLVEVAYAVKSYR